MDYAKYRAQQEKMKMIKLAAMRPVPCGLFHFLGGPIASVAYGSKTGEWMPTLAATGVAVAGIPLAIIDLGFTALIGAPLTSAILFISKGSEMRQRLGLHAAYQADELIYKEYNANPTPPTVEV